jgi:hypothetical protein
MAQTTAPAPVTTADRAAITVELTRYEQRYQMNLTPPERETIIANTLNEMQRMRANGDAGTVKQAILPTIFSFTQARNDPALAKKIDLGIEMHNAAYNASQAQDQMKEIEDREFPGWLGAQGLNRFQYETLPVARQDEMYGQFRSHLRENDSMYAYLTDMRNGMVQAYQATREGQQEG